MIFAGTKQGAWELGLDTWSYRFLGPLVRVKLGYALSETKVTWAFLWPWHRHWFYDGLCK